MSDYPASPRWNNSTKIIVGLTFVAIVAGLLIKFQNILPPMIIMIILAYLFNPIADFLSRKLRLPWKTAVTLVYLVAVLILVGMLALGGLGLVQQIQSLIDLVQNNLQNIPDIFAGISGRKFMIGPFLLDLSQVDLSVWRDQLISSLEPLLGQTGNMVSAIASGAANFLGWTLFVLMVSYFILVESDGLWRGILQVHIPGYERDLEQMGTQLAVIWNAFLRGQLIVMGISTIIYTFVLGVLGVHYALGLALLAGLARFVPYVGPLILWIILALVSYFQEFKLFGLDPWAYALVIVIIAWIIDGVLDNVIQPRVMASALKVHPAAVLVAAIVALDLLGILGVIMAAPMLATFQLIAHYFSHKLFDRDPWEGLEEAPRQPPLREQINAWVVLMRTKLKIR